MNAAEPGPSARRSRTTRRRRGPNVPIEPESGRLAYTVPEAAWLLHCGPNIVWRLIGDGTLPSFTMGRKRLIARPALEEFMRCGGTSTA